MTNKSEIRNGIQYKQCGTCKQFKPLSGFYKMTNGSFGVTAECRECGKQRAIEHRKAHPEYLNIKYKNDPKFRDKVKKRNRGFRTKNPEYFKKWRKKNPEYQNILYRDDPVFREMKKQKSRERYRAHPNYQKKRLKIKNQKIHS